MEKLIENCEVSKLKCLDYECRATFSEEEYKQILDEKMYLRMSRFQQALKVARDPDLFFCPNTKCESSLSLKELKKAIK